MNERSKTDKPDLNKTMRAIEELLSEYMKVKSAGNIYALLDIQDKIAMWAVRLAELCGDFKDTYNYSYFIRKINVAKKSFALIKSGSKIGAADTEALIENEEAMFEEQGNEAIAYKADLLLSQINKTLSGIQQRISHLKNEYKP